MKQPLYVLVDDDPINDMINERMLKKYHNDEVACQVFLDGKPAIEYFENGGEIPDMIFLDINMPNIDGWQFLEYYAEKDLSAPVVMLTSSIDPKDLAKSRKYEKGIDFVSKPLMPDAIAKLVSKIESAHE